MRRATFVALVVTAALMAVPLVASAGVGDPAFYVDSDLYRTVGTPTDFTNTGAPDHTFDTIYQFFDLQKYNVATAAPGDRGYNGGRWRVEVINGDYEKALAMFDANGSGDFDSTAEVHAALADGILYTSDGPSFECPVIPLPRGRALR